MAGKKIFTLEKPDDTAKELAAKLTLEEQVCSLLLCPRKLGPHCIVEQELEKDGCLWFMQRYFHFQNRFRLEVITRATSHFSNHNELLHPAENLEDGDIFLFSLSSSIAYVPYISLSTSDLRMSLLRVSRNV
jgi:hypothetical protein